MSLIARQPEGSGYELAPEGVYIARCYMLIDIGTQHVIRNSPTGARESDDAQVIIGWELFDGDNVREDGTPYTIEKTYKNSLWKTSNLFQDLTAWRGKPFTEEQLKGFELPTILDAYCQIQVAHNESGGNTYANIGSIMALPKGSAKPDGRLDNIMFEIEHPDATVFNNLRDYYKTKIEKAPEFKAPKGAQLVGVGTQPAGTDDVVMTDLLDEAELTDEPF